MNTRLRLALVVATLSALSALPAAPLDSSITAATVYLDRAVVTRSAALDLAVGEHELVFANLPAGLVDDSLQVAGRGTARATILDVAAKTQWLAATANDRIRTLEQEIEGFEKQLRVLADRTATLDQQQALLVRIGNATTTPPPAGKDTAPAPRPSTTEWQQLLEFYGAGFDRFAVEKQSIDPQREELSHKIEAVKAQLNELRSASGRNVKNVTVRVQVAAAGRLELTLGYALAGAAWSPAYDARLSTADRALVLGYFGVIHQNTGEEWKGIDLTLSTARPSLGGAAPEMQPWIVAQQENRMRKVMMEERDEMRSARALAPAPSVGGMAFADKEEREAVQQSASVDTQATSATFRIPTKTDVPSDNAPHKVGIATVPLKAELAYQSVPKLLPAAFLSAAVKNDSEYPLLGGKMAVFLDGTFVANAPLKTVMPGEKFDLALGADEGLRIERKLVNRFTEDLGIVSKEVRITYDVKITVTNNRRTAEKITVKDQLPLSQHEKIEVKQIEPDAKTLKPDEQGILTWVLDLKAGEKRELSLKLSVTYPRDFQVTGME
jgi:uncharacterized protein (TIGR02231 family)